MTSHSGVRSSRMRPYDSVGAAAGKAILLPRSRIGRRRVMRVPIIEAPFGNADEVADLLHAAGCHLSRCHGHAGICRAPAPARGTGCGTSAVPVRIPPPVLRERIASLRGTAGHESGRAEHRLRPHRIGCVGHGHPGRTRRRHVDGHLLGVGRSGIVAAPVGHRGHRQRGTGPRATSAKCPPPRMGAIRMPRSSSRCTCTGCAGRSARCRFRRTGSMRWCSPAASPNTDPDW